MTEITMTQRLDYLREWFTQHGSSIYDDADDWINSMTNVELLEALCWCEPEVPAAPRPPVTLGQLIREYAEANNIPIIDVKATEEDPSDLRGLPSTEEPTKLWKVILVSNFNSEVTSDQILEEATLSESEARAKADVYNSKPGAEMATYYAKAVPEDHKLYKFEP